MDNKSYPVWQYTLEATAISVFFLFVGFYIFSLIENFSARSEVSVALSLQLILYAVFSYITADFVSGLVHFLADNFGNPTTPILGKLFIFPFREHHIDAKAITRHSFVETNGANSMISLPPMIYLYYASAPVADYTMRFYFLVFFLSIFLTNQIHKWSHEDKVSPIVAFLQRAHLILPPEHHDIHHRPPFDKYYCITNGWLNPLLNGLHFFQALKRVLTWNFH